MSTRKLVTTNDYLFKRIFGYSSSEEITKDYILGKFLELPSI